jgi:hypothetical protein
MHSNAGCAACPCHQYSSKEVEVLSLDEYEPRGGRRVTALTALTQSQFADLTREDKEARMPFPLWSSRREQVLSEPKEKNR